VHDQLRPAINRRATLDTVPLSSLDGNRLLRTANWTATTAMSKYRKSRLVAVTAVSACLLAILPSVAMGGIPDFRHSPRVRTLPSGGTADQVSRPRNPTLSVGLDPK